MQRIRPSNSRVAKLQRPPLLLPMPLPESLREPDVDAPVAPTPQSESETPAAQPHPSPGESALVKPSSSGYVKRPPNPVVPDYSVARGLQLAKEAKERMARGEPAYGEPSGRPRKGWRPPSVQPRSARWNEETKQWEYHVL